MKTGRKHLERLDNTRTNWEVNFFHRAVEAIELGSEGLCLQGCVDIFVTFCWGINLTLVQEIVWVEGFLGNWIDLGVLQSSCVMPHWIFMTEKQTLFCPSVFGGNLPNLIGVLCAAIPEAMTWMGAPDEVRRTGYFLRFQVDNMNHVWEMPKWNCEDKVEHQGSDAVATMDWNNWLTSGPRRA